MYLPNQLKEKNNIYEILCENHSGLNPIASPTQK